MLPRHSAPLLIETLEPRILYSADLMPLASTGGTPLSGEHQLLDQTQPTTVQTELLFVDARINNYQTLVDDFMARAGAGRQIEVVVIGAEEDGVAKIGETLRGRQDIAAIHLLSHGESGAISLGNSRLDSDTLLIRAPEIAAWGSTLQADGDILVYGCDVAEGSTGKLFIDQLAALTGADVGASENLTGSSTQGGDWNLEYRVGTLEHTIAASRWAGPDWQNVLATYTVTNTNNSGAGSLRQAITNANGNAGTDTINFAIAGTGVHTITLGSALPSITGTVILDATTDDSFAANGNRPAIVLNGNGLGASGLVLDAGSGGSTIRGLVVNNFAGSDIQINTGSNGNTIAGNYLGTLNANGTLASGSANASFNLHIQSANNIIGGSTAADRNVIADSGSGYNVLIWTAAATGNQLSGNYIGTDATGTTVISGPVIAVDIESSAANNIIGGAGAGQGNVIATNAGIGVSIYSAGNGNVITGNRIGVSANGTSALAGTDIAMDISSNNVSVHDNWIAMARIGLWIESGYSGVTVQGNRIGTDLAGTANWGTSGVGIVSHGSNNTIGGTAAGQGNIVAYANQGLFGAPGIALAIGTGNSLLGNSVYGTAGGAPGIDLGVDGATLNDVGDADTGTNNLQNFPVLTSAKTNGSSQITIAGTLNSTANSYFRIELFANPSANSTGYGEGKTYLGFVNVATNGSGNASFTTTLAASVPVGYAISATATKSNSTYSAFTDTSEFAADIISTAATPGVIVVDTASDTLDGDTTSLYTLLASKGADGFISLREAIAAANNTANIGGIADTINFGISGTGVHTITLGSALPTINEAVVINAATDDSFAANGNKPAIILDGNGLATDGLVLGSGADGSTIRGFVITHFGNRGINILAGSDGNAIVGNYIGKLTAGGTAGTNTNGLSGLVISGSNNIIGGAAAADRNVISGNGSGGIYVDGGDNNQILGNYVGTNAVGTAAIANSNDGIYLLSGATGNLVQSNIVSGNLGNGILISNALSSNNSLRDNWIGIGADGTTLLGNGGAGIQITNAAGNTILGNRISGSTGLGIDLAGDGLTANDLGDADAGANNLQNFPVLTLAKTDGSSQITVAGTLNSTAGSYFRIELFANSTADPSGYGEAQIYLGFVNVATDGSGNASFSTTLSAAVPLGYAISATATNTDASYTSFTDTSEFAASLAAGSAPVNTVPSTQSVNEDTALSISGISVSDQGTLTLTVGLTALHGTLNVNLAGGATINAGANGTATLTLTGSVAQVNAALATLTYQANANYNGSDTLSVASTDPSTLTANSSISITVLPVNDAPTVSNGTIVVIASTDEKTTSTPVLVSSLLTSATWADADAVALNGVAITAAVGNGTWQYSTNGITWTTLGGVSASNALLLTDSSQIRYIPDGSNGETATLAFKAWDQTTGSGSLDGAPSHANPGAGGGSTAYSSQDASASLTVAAVNDAPIITSNGGGATASITLAENVSAVTTVTATDIDLPAQTLTYSISGADAGRFSINASTGVLTFSPAPDYDNPADSDANNIYEVTVTVSDGSLSDSQNISVTITPLNDNAPVITSNGGGATANINVPENNLAVTTVTATDADLPAQALTYSIIGGADAARFSINSGTGVLSFVSAPDFETPADSGGNNVYDLIVQVSDGALTGMQAIAVNVFNSNEAPTTSPLILTSIAEDSGPRLITQAELLANAADVDGPSLSAVGLTITAGNGSLVDNGNGTWAYTPAHNDNGSVSFAYTVTDGSLTAAGLATLAITPLNDAPTISAGTMTTLPGTDQLTTSGTTSVTSLLASAGWADVDSGSLKGIAIIGSSGMGTWQYSTNGSTWTAFGKVSSSNALLLSDISQIRYIPDGINGEIASFSYLAWDRTAGSASANGAPSYVVPGPGGGSSAYSAQQGSTSLTVSLSGTIQPITPTSPIAPTTPTTPVAPLPPVAQAPTTPATGTTQSGTGSTTTRQSPGTALPAIGDLFVTPGQPTGAGHFELAAFAISQEPQVAGGSMDFYSTRRWNVSYPTLQFKLQSIALQSIPGYSINTITQLDIKGSLTADRFHDESSAIPTVLEEGVDKLISPAGAVAATGVVFSAGVIWWAARAGGLMASLALSLPTWRTIDPLSVVGRKKDNPEDWGIDDDMDLERLRDERAVTGMLEDMTEQRL